MNKLPDFDAQLITETFFPDSVDHPWEINSGECMEWAYLAYLIFEHVELWDTYPNHAFVKWNGLFYDSEAIHGKEDPFDLAATCFCDEDCVCHPKQHEKNDVGVLSFQRPWKRKIDWVSLKQRAEDFLRDREH